LAWWWEVTWRRHARRHIRMGRGERRGEWQVSGCWWAARQWWRHATLQRWGHCARQRRKGAWGHAGERRREAFCCKVDEIDGCVGAGRTYGLVVVGTAACRGRPVLESVSRRWKLLGDSAGKPGNGNGGSPGAPMGFCSIRFGLACPSAAYEFVIESMTLCAFSWPISNSSLVNLAWTLEG
jgi:hypothetical protein